MCALKRVLAAILILGTACGCAARGPAYKEPGPWSEPPPDQMARLVFFRTRDSKLYIARTATIAVSGMNVGATPYGGFHYSDVPAGEHRLRADMWDAPGQCELTLDASGGQTYYFQVDPRNESFGAFAVTGFAAEMVSGGVLVGAAGGLAGSAAESYGKECGGAFRLYPVDKANAISRLRDLKHLQ